MRKTIIKHCGLVLPALVLLIGTGCVDILQVIYMEHEGHGRITESITVKPRAVRMLKKQNPGTTGSAGDKFALLSDAFLNERAKSYGAVTITSKKHSTLPDGSRRIEVEYAYKNINKVNLWVLPIFKKNDPKRQGRLKLNYSRITGNHSRPKRYFKTDSTSVTIDGHGPRAPSRRKYSSPVVLAAFDEITPIFQDMLSDFSLKIQIVAPIDSFEETGLGVKNMPWDGNKVTVLNIQGANIAGARAMIQQFIAGEVGGKSNAYGGTWNKMENALPDTYTPYSRNYYGIGFNFLKASPAPAKK